MWLCFNKQSYTGTGSYLDPQERQRRANEQILTEARSMMDEGIQIIITCESSVIDVIGGEGGGGSVFCLSVGLFVRLSVTHFGRTVTTYKTPIVDKQNS